MADPLPGAAGIPEPHWEHGWHEYEGYKDAHVAHMRRLENVGLVLHDGISFIETVESGDLISVNVSGRIECAGEVSIEIDKWLAVAKRSDGRFQVRGEFYTYQAWRAAGMIVMELLRYDSSTTESLHLHTFDRQGRETGKRGVALAELPNLDQFIEVVCALAITYSA